MMPPQHLHTLDFTLAELGETARCTINRHTIEVTDHHDDGYHFTIDGKTDELRNPYRYLSSIEAALHYIYGSSYVKGARIWEAVEEQHP